MARLALDRKAGRPVRSAAMTWVPEPLNGSMQTSPAP